MGGDRLLGPEGCGVWPLPGSGVKATVVRSLCLFLEFPCSSDDRQKAVAEPRPLNVTDLLLG